MSNPPNFSVAKNLNWQLEQAREAAYAEGYKNALDSDNTIEWYVQGFEAGIKYEKERRKNQILKVVKKKK